MNEKNPTVSVIIPTYNREHLIGRAIQSVLNQTYQDFEIIVVDDASTDNTQEVVKSFNDLRIRYIRHEKNRGGSAARNTGIRAARGEYIAFLDSDDEWLPEKLAEQIRVFHQDPECGVVYTDILVVYPDGCELQRRAPKIKGSMFHKLLEANVVGTTSSVLVRRDCFDKVGLFNEELASCQDWDMWIRLARLFVFRKVNIPLVKYTWGHEQISKNSEAVCRGREAIMKMYDVDIRALGRRVEAVHHFNLGISLCCLGEIPMGRLHLFQALVKWPWNPSYSFFYIFASLLGAKGFQLLVLIKRILRTIFLPRNRFGLLLRIRNLRVVTHNGR